MRFSTLDYSDKNYLWFFVENAATDAHRKPDFLESLPPLLRSQPDPLFVGQYVDVDRCSTGTVSRSACLGSGVNCVDLRANYVDRGADTYTEHHHRHDETGTRSHFSPLFAGKPQPQDVLA